MIKNLKLYRIFNSWGHPTVMVKIITDSGTYAASVPSGTSKGSHEAREMPSERVAKIFSKIRPMFIGLDEKDPSLADRRLKEIDSTQGFQKIGENLALAISIAFARAHTDNELWKLVGGKGLFPIPMGNVIGGGLHAGGTDWQEFLIIPHFSRNPREAVETMVEIWKSVGEDLKDKKLLTGKNVENAWTSRMDDFKTLEYLHDISLDWNVKIGIDFASSSLWNGKEYVYKKSRKKLKPGEQIELIKEITKEYKIYYLEDPLHQDGFTSFMRLTNELKGALITGDDLYCTSPERLRKGLRCKSTNSIIIKPNQIGTLTDTWETVKLARKHKMVIVPSHRSGETSDDWIADLSITWSAPLIKSGITGSDMPKLNRLIELWEEIPDSRMSPLPSP